MGAAKYEFGGMYFAFFTVSEYGEIQPQIFPYLQIRAVFGVPAAFVTNHFAVVYYTMLSEGLRVSRSYVHSVAPPVMPVVSSGRIQLDDEHNHLDMVQEIWPKWPDQNGQSRLSAPVRKRVC